MVKKSNVERHFTVGDARKAATAELKLKAEQSIYIIFLAYTSASAHTETYLQPRW